MRAVDVVDPLFLNSPQYEDEHLCRRLGRRLLVKNETLNPLRSFKGRGSDAMVDGLPRDRHVVCASAGNFGQAMAYSCRRAGMRCTVFLAAGANPLARERIELFGAEVVVGDGDEPVKRQAEAYAAAAPERIFVEDGRPPAIAEGAGTIGIELLEAGPIDAVILPVGDGALAAGVACWIKHQPGTVRTVGVSPATSPAMERAWRTGDPAPAPANTIADGLSVDEPIAESVRRLRALVDEMLLVSDSALVEAMRLAAETLGVLLEPSGAAGLAALLEHDPPGERVATVLTGSVLRPEHLALLA